MRWLLIIETFVEFYRKLQEWSLQSAVHLILKVEFLKILIGKNLINHVFCSRRLAQKYQRIKLPSHGQLMKKRQPSEYRLEDSLICRSIGVL